MYVEGVLAFYAGISEWYTIGSEKDPFLPVRFVTVASQDGSIYFYTLPNWPAKVAAGWKPDPAKRVICFDDPVNFVCASPCGWLLAYTQDTRSIGIQWGTSRTCQKMLPLYGMSVTNVLVCCSHRIE